MRWMNLRGPCTSTNTTKTNSQINEATEQQLDLPHSAELSVLSKLAENSTRIYPE